MKSMIESATARNDKKICFIVLELFI